jgi:hypothetical protein
MDSKQAKHVIEKVREKQSQGLDRSVVFGPGSSPIKNLANVPMSDVAQGASAGAAIGGTFGPKALLPSFLDDLGKRRMSLGLDKKLKFIEKVDPKSMLQALTTAMKKQKGLGKGALIGGGLAAVISALLGKEASEKRGFAGVENMQNQLQEQLRGAALRDILGTALVGAGAAGTIRGGQGLWNLLGRSRNKLRSRPGIAPLPVPYRPSFRDEEEEEKEAREKQAFEMPPQAPTKKSGLWWYMPAMLGAGAAGAYGGWKLVDSILDKRRRKEIEDEVDESRAGFQSALTSQYKKGSSSELGNALDDLYSKMQKQAGLNPSTWISPDTKGQLLGSYATYAIPSALLGYMVVKGLADKGSRKKILEKAQRRRALKQQKARPAELYAVPTPIEEEEE